MEQFRCFEGAQSTLKRIRKMQMRSSHALLSQSSQSVEDCCSCNAGLHCPRALVCCFPCCVQPCCGGAWGMQNLRGSNHVLVMKDLVVWIGFTYRWRYDCDASNVATGYPRNATNNSRCPSVPKRNTNNTERKPKTSAMPMISRLFELPRSSLRFLPIDHIPKPLCVSQDHIFIQYHQLTFASKHESCDSGYPA